VNAVNPYFTGAIDGQGPATTGFDGTTTWNASANYIASDVNLTYSNGGNLVTSGGSVVYGADSGTRNA